MGSSAEEISITRLDRADAAEWAVLYRVSVNGNEHLLYSDEILDRFGIPADALPAFCENA